MQPLLQDLLLAAASRTPERIALVCGAQRLTYAQLVQRARALASRLQAVGVQGGDRVLIRMENGAGFAVAFWAALLAGAVACPVHASTPAAKLAWYLDDTGAAALLTDAGGDEVAIEARMTPTRPREAARQLAAILYTSGSTGVPKGVMLGHANMLAAAAAIQSYLGYREEDVVLAALPMSFDYGLYQMVLAFAAGARLLLEASFNVLPQVVARMARERVTVLPGMPTVFALMQRFTPLASYDLGALRMVTSTGAPLAAGQVQWLQSAFPAAQLYSMYGLTECKRCSYLPPQDLARKPGSVGIPMPGLRFWVVDAQGRRLPPDTVGELVVQGPTVMQGYWGDAQATAERLRAGPEGTVLHTGDLCRVDAEGYLSIVGRLDDMIKSRGERVAPREIETALLDLPWVREAVVVGVPDEVQGQAIKAFVMLEPGAAVGERELRAALRGRLEPRLIPSAIELRDAFPVGPTGKTDRARLRQDLRQAPTGV
jgi:amino acid adenylation domain-containing protein